MVLPKVHKCMSFCGSQDLKGANLCTNDGVFSPEFCNFFDEIETWTNFGNFLTALYELYETSCIHVLPSFQSEGVTVIIENLYALPFLYFMKEIKFVRGLFDITFYILQN